MFAIDCPRHGARVLVTNRHILSIAEDGSGLVVRYRCWCGDEGRFHTGRPRRAEGVLG
jgi:hypothetical protein